jgi:hypothetical protein
MVDGMAAYAQSVALQDTRFAHLLLLSLVSIDPRMQFTD